LLFTSCGQGLVLGKVTRTTSVISTSDDPMRSGDIRDTQRQSVDRPLSLVFSGQWPTPFKQGWGSLWQAKQAGRVTDGAPGLESGIHQRLARPFPGAGFRVGGPSGFLVLSMPAAEPAGPLAVGSGFSASMLTGRLSAKLAASKRGDVSLLQRSTLPGAKPPVGVSRAPPFRRPRGVLVALALLEGGPQWS
jgi:hypothetical protein